MVAEPEFGVAAAGVTPASRGPGHMRHHLRVVGSPTEYTIALPPSLEQHLTLLTAALERPGTDLQAILEVLTDDLTEAFPSFLGLTISLTSAGHPVMVSTVRPTTGVPADVLHDTPIAASLQLPLASFSTAEPGSTLRFYASAPGVFAQLAADARATYGLDGDVVVDEHLLLPRGLDTGPPSTTTDINQAVGVLLAQGHPDPAAELDRQAAHHGLTRHQVAQRVLASLQGPPDNPSHQPAR